MQAITTRYMGPTNFRGSRIVAKAEAGRKVFSWNYELNSEQNHAAAARNLRDSLDWKGDMVGGDIKGGMVWVFKYSDAVINWAGPA